MPHFYYTWSAYLLPSSAVNVSRVKCNYFPFRTTTWPSIPISARTDYLPTNRKYLDYFEFDYIRVQRWFVPMEGTEMGRRKLQSSWRCSAILLFPISALPLAIIMFVCMRSLKTINSCYVTRLDKRRIRVVARFNSSKGIADVFLDPSEKRLLNWYLQRMWSRKDD